MKIFEVVAYINLRTRNPLLLRGSNNGQKRGNQKRGNQKPKGLNAKRGLRVFEIGNSVFQPKGPTIMEELEEMLLLIKTRLEDLARRLGINIEVPDDEK